MEPWNLPASYVCLVVITILTSLYGAKGQDKRSATISNGEKALTNEFPFMVSLQQTDSAQGTQYSHTCGASILNSRYLLTAAHCFSDNFPWIAVYGDNSNICTNLQTCKHIKVSNIYIHPDYLSQGYEVLNDIAIVKLESDLPINGNTVKAASIEIGSVPTDGSFSSIIAGWGTILDNRELPSDLMKAKIPIVSMTSCLDIGLVAESPQQVCAGAGNGIGMLFDG